MQHQQLTPRRLRELEILVKRAEESFDRNKMKSVESAPEDEDDELTNDLNQSKSTTNSKKPKKKVEFEDLKTASSVEESSRFFKHWNKSKRRVKLLKLLGSKSRAAGQEEGTIITKALNTITIHHTSRDQRFWRLRNRRRSSSA